MVDFARHRWLFSTKENGQPRPVRRVGPANDAAGSFFIFFNKETLHAGSLT